MIPQRPILAVAMLTMMAASGCPDGELDWECHAEKPCPNGELCVAPQDLPEDSTDPATDPACYTVCSSSAQCPGGNRACLDELCVLFDDDCAARDCPKGFFCNTAAHCEKYPSTAACDNLVRDGGESDVDCGGSCAPCADGRRCNGGGDCKSGVCDPAGSLCAVPTCNDGVANGGEVGVDCSGGCAALCPAGESCRDAGDCESGVCTANDNSCQAATCDDGVANQGESAIDCGGPCGGCPDGFACNVPDDCDSHVCADHTCASGTCADGTENNDETDEDCGGSCVPCAAGLKCGVAADCDSGVCDDGACRLLLSFGSTLNDRGVSVAVDTDDAILVTGHSANGMDLGAGVVAPGGFLAKLESSGGYRWSKPLPVLNYATLALDASGNTAVAGDTDDAGGIDIYLGSFPPGGDAANWSKLFECAGARCSGWATSVAGDSAGNVFAAGTRSGELSFGGGCSTLPGVGTHRAFVAKFSTNGVCVWAKGFGNDEALSYGVTSVADGGVVATGSFFDSIDLGNGLRTSGGSHDVFVVKLSSDGSHDWSTTFGGSEADYGRVVAGTSDGVVLAGDFSSESISLDGGESLESQGGSDLFVAKLALDDGSHLWSRSFGSAGRDNIADKVGVDADENIIVAGSFESTIGFGDTLLTSAGGYDMLVAMLSSAGAPIRSHRFGGPDHDKVGALSLNSRGRAVVVGTFGGTVSFGGSTLTSAGMDDICVFTVAP